MTEEEYLKIARDYNRRYLREWRQKNPDKVKAYNARYREKWKARREEVTNAKAENAND